MPSASRIRNEKLSTLLSFFQLLRWREFVITVDNFHDWREHLVWGKKDGDVARDYIIQRFSSNMVFLSLLLSTEIGVLFSPSKPGQAVRDAIQSDMKYDPKFWVGIFLIFDVITTLLAILSSFSAWAIISSLSGSNAQCIIRSTVGMYACVLPSRLLIASLYLFLIWISIWLGVFLPKSFSILFAMMAIIMFFHIITIYSALGEVLMDTGAMGEKPVLGIEEEEGMTPSELTVRLVEVAHSKRKVRVGSIYSQYSQKSFKEKSTVDNSLSSQSVSHPDPNGFHDEKSHNERRSASIFLKKSIIRGY